MNSSSVSFYSQCKSRVDMFGFKFCSDGQHTAVVVDTLASLLLSGPKPATYASSSSLYCIVKDGTTSLCCFVWLFLFRAQNPPDSAFCIICPSPVLLIKKLNRCSLPSYIAPSEMTQCVFMFIFLMLVFAVCSLATQKFSAATALFILPSCPWSVCVCLLFARAWPSRDENIHSLHMGRCFDLFVKILIWLFVKIVHFPYLYCLLLLSLSHLLVWPNMVKMAKMIRGAGRWSSDLTVLRESSTRNEMVRSRKYLEEYFSCGKNVWRPERSCGICVSDANNIEILYLGNTHTHTHTGVDLYYQ